MANVNSKVTNQALDLINRRIAQMEADLETLKKARGLFLVDGSKQSVSPKTSRTAPRQGGDAPSKERGASRKGGRKWGMTIADASSIILAERGKLHLRELLTELRNRYQMETSQKNLEKTISRWAKRKRLFRCVGPNTFAHLPPAAGSRKRRN